MKISISWHWISLSLLTFFLHLVNLVYYFALFILLTAVYIRFVLMPPPSPLTSVPMNESKKECLCCPLRLTGRVKSKKKKSLKATDVQRQLERSTNIIKNLSKIEKEETTRETKKKIEKLVFCSFYSRKITGRSGLLFPYYLYSWSEYECVFLSALLFVLLLLCLEFRSLIDWQVFYQVLPFLSLILTKKKQAVGSEDAQIEEKKEGQQT